MERVSQLKDLYNQARKAGLCFTQKEFAALIGISPTNFSSAMNGDEKYLTDNLFSKIEKLFTEHNLQPVTDNHGTVIQSQKKFTQKENSTSEQERIDKFLDLLKEKDVQVNRLLTIIENMQAK